MGNKIPTDINMFEQACSMNYKQMTNEDIRPVIPAPASGEKLGRPILSSPDTSPIVFSELIYNTPDSALEVSGKATPTAYLNPISGLTIKDVATGTMTLRYLFTAASSNFTLKYVNNYARNILDSDGNPLYYAIFKGVTYCLTCEITWTSTSISTFVGYLTPYNKAIECEII